MPCVVSQLVRWTHIKLCLSCTSASQWVEPEGREKAPSVSPATGETLCTNTQATEEDVDRAVAAGERQWRWSKCMPTQTHLYSLLLAAQAALPGWSGLPGHVRARHLYSIARHLQKHHRLMAVVESLDNGKSVRETRYNSDAHHIWTNHALTRVLCHPPSPVMLMCLSPFATFTPTLAGRS